MRTAGLLLAAIAAAASVNADIHRLVPISLSWAASALPPFLFLHTSHAHSSMSDRMKLKKLPLTEQSLLADASHFRPSPAQEAEFLRHKHLGLAHEESEMFGQKPLMGLGGTGRKGRHQKLEHEGLNDEERDRFWTQMIGPDGNEKRMLKGGHGVPLSGELAGFCHCGTR